MTSTGQESELLIRISPGSVLFAMLILNMAMLICCLLRRSTRLLSVFSSKPLLWLWLLGMARALFPVEFSFARHIPKPAWLTLAPIAQELVLFWILGSLVAVLYWGQMLLLERRTRRQYLVKRSEQTERLAERMGLRNVRITVSPDVEVPFVTGFFRPHIYLPDLKLSDRALEWILQHELRHVRLKDPLIKAVYLVMMVCFWWNPAVYFFRAELDRLLELRCDASLTGSCSREERLSYLSTLLEVIRRCNPTSQQQLLGATLTSLSNAETIKQRFRVVVEHPLPSAKLVAAMTLTVTGIHFLSYFITL